MPLCAITGACGLSQRMGSSSRNNGLIFIISPCHWLCTTSINGNNIALTVSTPIVQRYTDCKRDKQRKKETNKQTPIFPLSPPCGGNCHQTWHVDRACPYHFWAQFHFLCLTSSFGARGLRKFGGNDPSQFCAYKFVIYKPNCTKF